MYAANPNRPLKKCDSDIPIAPAAEVWNAMMKKMPTAIRMMDTISVSYTHLSAFLIDFKDGFLAAFASSAASGFAATVVSPSIEVISTSVYGCL